VWLLFLFRQCLCVLVQVKMKDIPSRVDTVNGEQQLLNKSLLDLKTRDGDVPGLATAVEALTVQVGAVCELFMINIFCCIIARRQNR